MFSLRGLNRKALVTLLVLGGILYAVRGTGEPSRSWQAAALVVVLLVVVVLIKAIAEGLLFRRRNRP
ncbi:MAG: hypothetical protein KatS3mg115_2505 [Candidatus Poribacteria bacterium]|nr:MAG: hypothetical protein KatS3mg115_2505 [Candidatus Poribacteria bacterium]